MKRVVCFVFSLCFVLLPCLAVDDGAGSEALEVDSSLPSVGEGLDSGGLDLMSLSGVSTVEVHSDTVVMSLPEDNEYPSDAPISGGLYIDCNTSQFGRVTVYLPIDYQRYSIAFNTAGNLVNIRSSTISGYMYVGSNVYNFRMTSMGTPQYRLLDTGYTYSDLSVTSINNTNVVFVESSDDIPLIPNDELYLLICVMLLGVITLCQFMKRF